MPQQYDASTRSYRQSGVPEQGPISIATGWSPEHIQSGTAAYNFNLAGPNSEQGYRMANQDPGSGLWFDDESGLAIRTDMVSTTRFPEAPRPDGRKGGYWGQFGFTNAVAAARERIETEQAPERAATQSHEAQARRWRALGGYVTRQANRGTILTSPSGLPGSATFSGGGTQTMLGGDGAGL